MKYNVNTGKFEEIKVVETKVEIDPRVAFYNMVLENHKEFRSGIVYDYIGHPARHNAGLNWILMPISFPPANAEWAMAVAKALVKFCNTYNAFIVNSQYLHEADRKNFPIGLVISF
jgi:hypothetical protein